MLFVFSKQPSAPPCSYPNPLARLPLLPSDALVSPLPLSFSFRVRPPAPLSRSLLSAPFIAVKMKKGAAPIVRSSWTNKEAMHPNKKLDGIDGCALHGVGKWGTQGKRGMQT